ncbi:S8 family serine peptidase [Halobacillus karajensis]|uniref:PII-type proteinase n=1 Tax=Halobacillus karajensis TaxID=195088 RepID=A0A059NZ23_9BACI|nr:S8 family serine peptidase [Halobacillus karajensis]CDQ18934.1 PII-type proteinase precursor [Halobacillus karajensis]CDQ22993.1 PII-type proteinase precursor [Halobacillus karajensis]CDQ26475.1 PII-type proteinase precursor [Halobacillus karajensis]
MKLKKSLILMFIFLLAFSNSVFAATGVPNKNLEEASKSAEKTTERVFKAEGEDKDKSYDANEEVRIIVELEDEPTIYSAQSLGKSYSELSDSNKQKLRKAALDAQDQVKSSIQSQSIPMDYKESFTTVVNGFSGTVPYKSVAVIEDLPNVGNVHITNEYKRPTEQPEMLYSKELVKAQQTWQEYGYKGEGMTVGVIDTGIDPDHKDMILSDETEPEISQDDVDALTSSGELDGKYFTEKVPYGYNYADGNEQVLDLGPDASMHGMHVSGTVGANGDEENGGIKGVAPEAQILGLKVFGNDPEMPSTYGDIYVKAIDDAILLGADVINMSLGSTASFVNEEDPEQKAIARAVDNGVMMAISAGNSAKFGEGFGNPLASNPDIGLVGAPGLSTDSLQVASFENEYLMLDGFTTRVNGEEGDPVPFLSASSIEPESLEDGYHEVVYAGLGRTPGDSDANPEANDFEGIDVKDKIVLIQRGESTFVSKTLNAQEHGAKGVIIFNNVGGYISMASSGEINIPQLSILKELGENMRDELEAGNTVEISFEGEEVKSINPEFGNLSSFTSWGVTPNLDFKPEITAPGGNILSTLQEDEYGLMSGTSMAAPHVAGGSALVMQRIEEDFDVEGQDRVELAKNILMNTSEPQIDTGLYNDHYQSGLGFSPRRQGAGLMDLHAAMQTPVIATEKESGLGKVALKEIDNEKETFTLTVENFSDENTVYNVSGTVQTDLVADGENLVETQGIYKEGTISEEEPYAGEFPIEITSSNGSEVDGEYQVLVPAESSVDIEVTVDLSEGIDWFYNVPLEEIFENGYFVEGFITLEDPNDVNPVLNVPYVGFNGEWDQAPIIDDTIYDGEEGESFYGQTGLLTPLGAELHYLGVDPLLGEEEALAGSKRNIGFSPDGDQMADTVMPILSFLRNAKEVEFNILNEDKEKLRTLRSQDEVRKHYYDGGSGPSYTIYDKAAWDGRVKGEVVEDGLYYYEVKSVVDYPDAEWQSKLIPVRVDTQTPSLDVTYDKETKEVAWEADDQGSGLSHFDVLVNGKSVLEQPLAAAANSYELETDEVESVRVVAHDYAGNTTTDSALEGEDGTIPYVTALTPEALEYYTDRAVQVVGYVQDDSEVESLAINGEEVKLTWDSENKRYNFNTTINFKSDGMKELEFVAVDDSGNDISFTRRFLLDTTSPEVTVDGPHMSSEDEVDVAVNMKDNDDSLRLYVDGSEVFAQESKSPYNMEAIEKDYTHTVQLEQGKNSFKLEVEDGAGHVTSKQITIYQSDEEPKDFTDVGDSYWAKEAIQKLNVAGVINGYPNGDFGIDDPITRRQAAQMIVRAFDLDTSQVEDPGLADIQSGDRAYEEIAAIANAGIMVGSDKGEFMPDKTLTRAEMAKIVVEAYELEGSTSKKFKDVPLTNWAAPYINTLYANEITTGYTDGTFQPNNETRRSEFAMFLARAEDDRFKK